MKGTVKGSDLSAAMALIDGVVGRSGALLDTSVVLAMEESDGGMGGQLRLRGTDREQYLTVAIKCALVQPGVAALNAQKVAQIAREMEGGDVLFDGDPMAVNVKGPGGKFKLSGVADIDKYPDPPDLPAADAPATTAEFFSNALRQAAVAAARDEKAGILNAVYLVCPEGEGGDVAKLYGTDRNCMIRVSLPLKSKAGVAMAFPVPLKALRSLQAVTKHAETVRFGPASGQLVVVGGNDALSFQLGVRLIDGAYPNLDAAVDMVSKFPHVMTAQAADLTAAVRRASIVAAGATESSDYRRIVLEFTKTGLSVKAESNDGSAEIDVKCEGYAEDDPLCIAFNAPFLSQWLALALGTVTMRGTGGKPMLFTCTAAPTYIATPMSL